jgi:uncharacterized protein YjbI with pentapeptide repeats
MNGNPQETIHYTYHIRGTGGQGACLAVQAVLQEHGLCGHTAWTSPEWRFLYLTLLEPDAVAALLGDLSTRFKVAVNDGTPPSLCQTRLAGAGLRGVDLSGARLAGTDLSDADLRQAKLMGADLARTDLSEARLMGADLRGARLCGANLSRADLSEANLTEADLSETVLDQTNLSQANLSGAILRGADLSGADLSGAKLIRTDLIRANLIRTILIQADLSEAILNGANLEESIVFDEQLAKAKSLQDITLPDGTQYTGPHPHPILRPPAHR